MKFEYKTVITSNLKGIRYAERLLNAGWRIISNGMDTLLFERKIK